MMDGLSISRGYKNDTLSNSFSCLKQHNDLLSYPKVKANRYKLHLPLPSFSLAQCTSNLPLKSKNLKTILICLKLKNVSHCIS